MARDGQAHLPIYQALAYPVMNYGFDTPSYAHNAYVRPLTRDEMRWFWRHYLPNTAAGANPYASPLRVEDVSGLPPALVLTAEYDVLRDEGEAYGRRLEEGGVPTVVRRYAGMTHGFLGMAPVVEKARAGVVEMGSWLRVAFRAGEEERALA
jgi:acetyl esterase